MKDSDLIVFVDGPRNGKAVENGKVQCARDFVKIIKDKFMFVEEKQRLLLFLIDFFRQSFRKVVRIFVPNYKINCSETEAVDLIKDGINNDAPFLCVRLGCTELQTMAFVRMSQIWGLGWLMKPFWKGVVYSIENSSGVLKSTPSSLCRFTDLYEELFSDIDILSSWHPSERFFDKFFKNKKKIHYADQQPNFITSSWTPALKGKKILVVHPFAESIKSQYEKRLELFDDPEILPEFETLYTLKAVQSVAGNIPDGFNTWFDALYYMRSEMEKINYDVALIACGAYGFPLAAWAKQKVRRHWCLGEVCSCFLVLKDVAG